jgi:PAS domain S-box-containing protein
LNLGVFDVPVLVGDQPWASGDPQSPLRWTSKSVRRLTQELKGMGHVVGHTTLNESDRLFLDKPLIVAEGRYKMAAQGKPRTQASVVKSEGRGTKSSGSIHTDIILDAEIIIANAPDPVFVSDLEGKILQANDAVSQLLGFRQDEVLEQWLTRFIRPEEARELTAALREVVERGVMRNVVLNPRSASGEVISTSLNASALRDADGTVIGVIGILRDMRELDKARAYAENLIKNAPDPVFVSDLEGKILQANDAVFTLLGFRPDEVIEQSLSRIISLDETREFLAALREVVERGVTRNARLNPRTASGEIIPTTLNASALRDADGKVTGAIGILRDMREYEKVVRDLEKSKSELQDKILDLEKFEEVVVGRELKMIALEKELEHLRKRSGG